MIDKVLIGLAGAAGISFTAWKTMFPWIGDDLKILQAGYKVRKVMNEEIEQAYFLIDKFEDKVKLHPDKPFIIYDHNIYSFQYVDQQANKVANIAKRWGLTVGDTVALYASNSPSFIWTFLGLAKLGVTVALINSNLQGKALVHCVKASGGKILIVGEGMELLNTVIELDTELDNYDIYIQGSSKDQIPPNYTSFDDLMRKTMPTPVHKNVRSKMNVMSTFCFIYTSGTTGLPKPVFILHIKGISLSKLVGLFGLSENDIFYLFLPLYHTSGCMSLFGAIDVGATVVIRKKFSVSYFWKDVHQYNITVIQYIGELCRYLLNGPKDPLENQHKIKVMFGNGLRKDIWTKFQTRFNIPKIVEFFGATEGTGFTFQLSNKPGAIGRYSPLIKKIDPSPKRIVKYDFATAEPIRDQNGRCIEIKPGESGLILSIIPDVVRSLPFYRASQEDNNKKIVLNAFEEGDAYFNYGDLFYLDKDYFLYFQDRLGDTFRWKGENVSTTEVANILTNVDFIQDANVYGVTVPGHDGRAGMAALTLTDIQELSEDNLKTIYNHCEEELPRYARPIFLRVLEEADLTSTFKQRKVDLIKEGYNPSVVKDPLYFRDDSKKTFVPLTFQLFTSGVAKSKL
ncbi:hypothetical protein SNE40_012217 [Patella caerulea]|uniref:long-chain-fatty-acid--CoA ligase n=2 Tax=Patella caerulea TaxID=87958 RepID=A0AAN8PMX3_PATCE